MAIITKLFRLCRVSPSRISFHQNIFSVWTKFPHLFCTDRSTIPISKCRGIHSSIRSLFSNNATSNRNGRPKLCGIEAARNGDIGEEKIENALNSCRSFTTAFSCEAVPCQSKSDLAVVFRNTDKQKAYGLQVKTCGKRRSSGSYHFNDKIRGYGDLGMVLLYHPLYDDPNLPERCWFIKGATLDAYLERKGVKTLTIHSGDDFDQMYSVSLDPGHPHFLGKHIKKNTQNLHVYTLPELQRSSRSKNDLKEVEGRVRLSGLLQRADVELIAERKSFVQFDVFWRYRGYELKVQNKTASWIMASSGLLLPPGPAATQTGISPGREILCLPEHVASDRDGSSDCSARKISSSQHRFGAFSAFKTGTVGAPYDVNDFHIATVVSPTVRHPHPTFQDLKQQLVVPSQVHIFTNTTLFEKGILSGKLRDSQTVCERVSVGKQGMTLNYPQVTENARITPRGNSMSGVRKLGDSWKNANLLSLEGSEEEMTRASQQLKCILDTYVKDFVLGNHVRYRGVEAPTGCADTHMNVTFACHGTNVTSVTRFGKHGWGV
eukprot:GDKI01046016.1.p1 GENE.GDKI01046016.1~~GDKI01046016.1.p1  ORF type:complete len:548 (-),score=19.49 GDKI01046016.1:190-1833(-)